MMLRSHRLSRFRLVVLLIPPLLLALGGCGSSDSDKLAPVSGRVMVGGKPLTRGSVSFRADKARGNTSPVEPYGEIAEDGTYTLYTNQKKGAPVGRYAVLVTATEEVDPSNQSAAPKSLIDPKYADPQKPILQVDVVENPKPGQYDLQVSK